MPLKKLFISFILVFLTLHMFAGGVTVNTTNGIATNITLNGVSLITTAKIGGIKLTNATVNKALITDSSNDITNATTTSTQINYLQNVTSDVQGQLNNSVTSITGDGVSTDGSTITPSGQNITLLNNQSVIPNYFVAGPSGGGTGPLLLRTITDSDLNYLTSPIFDGVNIQSLNASQLTSGTVPTARLGSGTANSGTVLIGNNTWGAVNLSSMTTGTLSGSAVSGVPLLTNANTFLSSNLFSKTIYADSGYLTNWATIATLSNTTAKIGTLTLTNALSGSSVSGGTFGAVNGSALTALNGTQITSGTVPAAQLGSGTANSGTVLLGNNTWGTYSLSALGGIANNAGAGTNTSLVNPSLSGIESNTSSGTYIGTNLFTNGATFYAMTNYPKNLIGNGVSTLFTVNSSNHRHLWTITSGSLPAGALPGWDIMLTNLQFKIVMINSSTSFWTFDGGGSDFTGASVTAMYPNAVDWVDINHTPNGGIDNGASPFVQTIVGPTGNNGRIILGGGTNSFQLSIGSFNDGTDFTVEGMGGSNSAVGPTTVMTLNGQAPTSLQVLSNGIVNLSSRAYYGVSIGDYLNLAGADASVFPPQLVWPTYSTTAARPYIVWDGAANWMGIGPANISDNTVRFGWTTFPFNGPSSEWPTFGTHPSPYEFDSSTFGIGVNVPTHALDVSGTTAANFHQGISTVGTATGTITATGWTNTIGTNCMIDYDASSSTITNFDSSGANWRTNSALTGGDYFTIVQPAGGIKASGGLSGTWHVL